MKSLLYLRTILSSAAELIVTVFKIIFLSKWFAKLPPTKGESIALLANGTSLNNAIERMRQDGMPENIMVVNLFCKSPFYEELKPNYYVICDPSFGSLSEERPDIKEFFLELYRRTAWNIVFFVPWRLLKRVKMIIEELELNNPHVLITGYNNINFNGDHRFNYLFFKWKLGMPRPTTVAVTAAALCIQMGYRSVKLAGIDLNQHQDIFIDKNNRLMLRSAHFYSDEKHLIPFYKNKLKNETFTSSEIFLIFHYFFYSFDIIAKFAKIQKVEIINYSEESFLDQFKKI